MGQLLDVNTVEIAQFHGDFLVGIGLTPSCLNIPTVRNRQQAQQGRWASDMWFVGKEGHGNRKVMADSA